MEGQSQVTSPYCTIMLATDGSREARRASMHAIYLARALGIKLYVLYVVDTHRTQTLGIHFAEAVQELKQSGENAIADILAVAKDVGVDAEGILAEGSPGPQVCQVARERKVDLIVVGATGKSALAEILMGSVSRYVTDHAKQPVLVVRS